MSSSFMQTLTKQLRAKLDKEREELDLPKRYLRMLIRADFLYIKGKGNEVFKVIKFDGVDYSSKKNINRSLNNSTVLVKTNNIGKPEIRVTEVLKNVIYIPFKLGDRFKFKYKKDCDGLSATMEYTGKVVGLSRHGTKVVIHLEIDELETLRVLYLNSVDIVRYL